MRAQVEGSMHFCLPADPETNQQPVLPSGIHADDQLHLFHPRPALQLLFASSGSIYIFEPFPIYKPVKFVSAGEAFESTYLVLKHAIANVISNANVKILRAIRHYVNVEPFL